MIQFDLRIFFSDGLVKNHQLATPHYMWGLKKNKPSNLRILTKQPGFFMESKGSPHVDWRPSSYHHVDQALIFFGVKIQFSACGTGYIGGNYMEMIWMFPKIVGFPPQIIHFCLVLYLFLETPIWT